MKNSQQAIVLTGNLVYSVQKIQVTHKNSERY